MQVVFISDDLCDDKNNDRYDVFIAIGNVLTQSNDDVRLNVLFLRDYVLWLHFVDKIYCYLQKEDCYCL